MTLIKTLACALFLLLIIACRDDISIGRPLLSFDFNNNIHNKGLAKVAVFGPQSIAYHCEKKDTCLDLSLHSISRKPLTVKFKDFFSLNDYDGFTVAVRVKKHPEDDREYTILSQEKCDTRGVNGWRIIAQSNGAWGWQLSDEVSRWSYRPTKKQTINDGQWHHLVFSYNVTRQEARLFYDGKNVAVYSVYENRMQLDSIPLSIGVSSASKHPSRDVYNGCIDDLAMWSRALSSKEITALYREKGNNKIKHTEPDEQLTVLTWNIWDGGVHDGKYVGVMRIIDVIKGVKPDILILQEANETGAAIADALDYTLYYRSKRLNLLSPYPMGKCYNLYRPENAACIELELNEDESVLACPVFLSDRPPLDEYIKSGKAVEDSVLLLEESTRGKEMQFILSELAQLSLKADEMPIVLAGDFNSGSHLDWTNNNHANYRNLTIAFPATKKLETKGYTDSFRYLYPDETKFLGQTWSPRSNQVVSNRIDYIFYKGKKLTPVKSFLIDDYPLGFPSNHAALVTTFEWRNE